ncbi:hypothetical protein GCM10009768_31440 [Leucobacter iarius]|uniref:Uncharacterized protein n=1 Tax=Leucobacter iarius TaxID=333963 RepID=A0ABN2LV43_9MICO
MDNCSLDREITREITRESKRDSEGPGQRERESGREGERGVLRRGKDPAVPQLGVPILSA